MTSLIIDIGSSSVRAMLVSADLNMIAGASVQRTYQFDLEPEGASTVDALLLRQLTESCIDEVLTHPRAKDITAVGMATFVGNVLGVSAENIPVTPVFTYADSRSVADVDILRDKIDRSTTHQRTGCRLHTAYHPSRLHWLRRTQPDVYQSVHQWLDVATYLYRCWLNPSVPMSYSVASWSGMLNREALTWDAEWLDLLALSSESLPELAEFTQVQTGLLADYGARWPILRNVPFFLAVGDGCAANVGSGGVSRDRPVLTIGTTSALRLITDEVLPPVPEGLWAYRVDADHHLIGGATSEGGNIFAWAVQALKLNLDQIEADLQTRLPAAHGLIFLPLLAGERSPGWYSQAVGTLHGLRLSTTPQDILQAALEGVALRLATVADAFILSDAPVYASGGALGRSPAWAQMMANAFNRPVYHLHEPQITTRGVAILIQRWPDSSLPEPEIDTVFEPVDSAVQKLYDARKRQENLYQLVMQANL
jgi:gluconokinase